jgi:hypothetical protein
MRINIMKYLFEKKKSICSVIIIDIYFVLSVCLLIELVFRDIQILEFFFVVVIVSFKRK